MIVQCFFSPGPAGPLPCTFQTIPCPNTPDSNEWVVIRLRQSLITSSAFESAMPECKHSTLSFVQINEFTMQILEVLFLIFNIIRSEQPK